NIYSYYRLDARYKIFSELKSQKPAEPSDTSSDAHIDKQ
ncbi:unnamed protein product, partial [marine sediment metagenome]